MSDVLVVVRKARSLYNAPMASEIRPRFELETDEDMDALLERVSRRLRSKDCPLCGIASDGRIELYVPPVRQRLWSPELRVDVRRTAHGALLRGTYGPHPHVWMAYAALLVLSAVSAIAAVTFALAQWSMHQPVSAVYALPPIMLVFALTYRLAFVGQGLATGEMDELRAFLDEAVFASAPIASGVRHRKSGSEPDALVETA